MKTRFWVIGLAVGILLGLGAAAQAYKNVYKWVKDKTVHSDLVLPAAKVSRVVPVSETAALDLVRTVLAEDLFMAVTEYHKTKHAQDAETTADSVLPEAIAGQKDLELIDENYRFFLQVKLRAFGGRTRITAKASPMYRVHDADAESEANSGTAQSSLTVNAGAGATVAVAAAFITPIEGLPLEYQCEVLPDAAERGAELVKSFMYYLDRRIAAGKSARPQGKAHLADPGSNPASGGTDAREISGAPGAASAAVDAQGNADAQAIAK